MTNTTAFIDASARPSAIPFHDPFPDESTLPETPGGSVAVVGIVKLRDRKVVTLLDAIGDRVMSGGNVLIVMHGNDAGLFAEFGFGRRGRVPQRVLQQQNALEVIQKNTE